MPALGRRGYVRDELELDVHAIGNVQSCVSSGLLYEPNEVAGEAFGFQIGIGFEVEGDEALAAGLERPAVLIAMDDALNVLARRDPLLAELIELRYFGGLTAEESSVVVNREIREIQHNLALAKAWLRRYLAT